MKKLSLLILALILCSGCSGGMRIYRDQPLIERDLSGYADKRVVVLAFDEPGPQPGIGVAFASELHGRLLQGGSFAQVSLALDSSPYGLQSTPRDELASAAAMGAELGADLAITGAVERFHYSRGADSELTVVVYFIDTFSGEVLRADRLSARGKAGSFPPIWEPGLSSGPEKNEIIAQLAAEILWRLGPHYDQSNA